MAWLSRLATRFSAIHSATKRCERGISALQHSRLARLLRPLVERSKKLGLLSSPNRFVLTFGDEGASLIRFQGRQVVDALFIAPDAEDWADTLRSYLADDPQAQILVSADVLEQMYREEQLPRVGRLDRLNIVKRRLDIAFPHDRLKAAVPLERAKSDAGTVLFTALPVTKTSRNGSNSSKACPIR